MGREKAVFSGLQCFFVLFFILFFILFTIYFYFLFSIFYFLFSILYSLFPILFSIFYLLFSTPIPHLPSTSTSNPHFHFCLLFLLVVYFFFVSCERFSPSQIHPSLQPRSRLTLPSQSVRLPSRICKLRVSATSHDRPNKERCAFSTRGCPQRLVLAGFSSSHPYCQLVCQLPGEVFFVLLRNCGMWRMAFVSPVSAAATV